MPRHSVRKGLEPIGGALQLAFIAAVLAITLVLAIAVPPRHIDPTSYHVPRVYQWIQNHSLAPFPTHVERQIWIGPGAEYFLLHLRLLAGTDLVLNLAQWLAFAGTVPVASLIARELGGSVRAQRFAALFAITIPMAIVQASGGHVDEFASFWLCVSVALVLRVRRQRMESTSARDAIALGSATGIAVLSKAMNALFVIPFAIWCVASLLRHGNVSGRRLVTLSTIAIMSAAAVNAPAAYRNYEIWSNPLGDPGQHHLSNETLSVASVTSDMIKNASVHLNWFGNSKWNGILNYAIIRIHDGLGISADDRRTTYSSYHFRISPKSEDEGSAGNPLHLLLIVAATIVAWTSRRDDTRWYLACVLLGALIFSAYLKWQPWGSRFQLPLFVVAAGGVAVVADRLNRRNARRVLSGMLALSAVPALLIHADHQLIGSHSIFRTPYERRFFKFDTMIPAYTKGVDLAAARGCRNIGVISNSFESPLWRLLHNRFGDDFRVEQVYVANPTARFAAPGWKPCIVFVLLYSTPQLVPGPPAGFYTAIRDGGVAVFLPARGLRRTAPSCSATSERHN